MADKDHQIDDAEKAFGDGVNTLRNGAMGFNDEFMEFLRKYQVIGLAVAVVIGTAATKLVNATVNDLIMPVIAVVTPAGNWQTSVFEIGPMKFPLGDYVSAIIDFMIIALVIFLAVKYLMKGDMGRKI